MKILLIMLAMMLSGLALPVEAETDDDTSVIVKDFREAVTLAVEAIIADDTLIINKVLTIMTRALLFLAIFWQVCLFIWKGFDPESMIPFLVGIFVVGILNESYGVWTNGIFDFWDGAGLSIQESVTGTNSRHFITQYFTHMYSRISFQDVGFWDSLTMLFAGGVFLLVQSILMLAIRFAELWAVWGFNFTLLIGPLFIPFLIHHRTAFLFEKWFMLMLGFSIFSFVVRVMGVIYYIFTQVFLGGAELDRIILLYQLDNEYWNLLLHATLGVFLIISAGSISSAIAGGVSGSIGGGMRGVSQGLRSATGIFRR